MREAVVENEFVKAVQKAGGVAYKLTSQTTNGLPDRMVLFFPAKTVFVELKAPGKMLRPLQRKRRCQLQKLGFPVLCIDRLSQIKPSSRQSWIGHPGSHFQKGSVRRCRSWKWPHWLLYQAAQSHWLTWMISGKPWNRLNLQSWSNFMIWTRVLTILRKRVKRLLPENRAVLRAG